jgi:hypothetical protein
MVFQFFSHFLEKSGAKNSRKFLKYFLEKDGAKNAFHIF